MPQTFLFKRTAALSFIPPASIDVSHLFYISYLVGLSGADVLICSLVVLGPLNFFFREIVRLIVFFNFRSVLSSSLIMVMRPLAIEDISHDLSYGRI